MRTCCTKKLGKSIRSSKSIPRRLWRSICLRSVWFVLWTIWYRTTIDQSRRLTLLAWNIRQKSAARSNHHPEIIRRTRLRSHPSRTTRPRSRMWIRVEFHVAVRRLFALWMFVWMQPFAHLQRGKRVSSTARFRQHNVFRTCTSKSQGHSTFPTSSHPHWFSPRKHK